MRYRIEDNNYLNLIKREMSKINLYRQLGPIGSGNFGEVIKVERKRDKVRDCDRVTCSETVCNEET